MKRKQFAVCSGFTLLEMLVASLLMGLLVTILTMVFNASSIAWRTGKAGISQLSSIRRQLSLAQYQSDNLLPVVDPNSASTVGCVGGAWKSDGTIRTRAVSKMDKVDVFQVPNFNNFNSAKDNQVQAWVKFDCQGSIALGSSRTYVVGVYSLGPDGKENTEDDITTWPLGVE